MLIIEQKERNAPRSKWTLYRVMNTRKANLFMRLHRDDVKVEYRIRIPHKKGDA